MKFLYAFLPLVFISLQALSVETEDSTRNYNIEDIVVKSYRLDMMLKDAPNKVEVITSGQIARSAALNVADLIKKSTPCESVDLQGLNGGVDFRGFAPGAMGVNRFSSMLLDGMPMGTMNAATTLMSGIGSVEILKGPFSALYGSGAMGGVINIITNQSRGKIGGSATVGFGSFNTSQANVSAGGNITERFDFDLSLEYLNQNNDYKTGKHNLLHTSDYEKQILAPDTYGKIYDNTAYDKNGAILRLGYDISDHWRINLYNNIYYTSSATSNGTIWGKDGQTDKGIVRNYHRIDLSYKNDVHSVRFSPYYSRETADADFVSAWGSSVEEKSYSTYGFQLQDMIVLPFGRFVVGIDNFSQRNKSTRKEGGNEVYPWLPSYLDMQTSAFAQINISLFDNKLTSVAGVRYDNTLFRTFRTPHMDVESSSKFYNSLNPSFAIKYKITERFNVHGSLGRAFLAPDAYKTVGTYQTYTTFIGNPDLKPEIAFTTDIGAGYSTRDGAFEADMTLFFTQHKDLIGNKYVDANTSTYVNSDKAVMQGYEAMFSIDFGRMARRLYSLKLFANYTRIFKSKVTTGEVTSERLYVSRNSATFGTEYINKRFSARLSGRYSGDKLNENFIDSKDFYFRESLINEYILRMPDFMVFDVYADYRLFRGVSVGVKCTNLLDENYVERDGYNMCGRSFFGQLSIRF